MKRALLISILAAFGAMTTVACGDSTDALTNGSGTEPKADTDDDGDDEGEDEAASKKSETKDPVKTPETPKTETPKNTGDQCTPDNDDPKECAKCCAELHNPLQGCACGAGSKCGDACGDNLCTGEMPSLQCGLCMLQSQCDFGFGDEGGGFEDFAKGELAQCLQQCAPQ